MKRPRPVTLTFASFALFAMTAAAPAVANTLATWTDSTGNHAWEMPANWDINQVPSNNSYDVRIATSAPCNLSSQYQIGSLDLATNTASLSLVPNSLLAISSPSGLHNSNAILVNTTAGSFPTTLRFDTNASISGAGTIRLNGINPGDAALSANGVTVTHSSTHTISGRGDLSFSANQTVFVNNGTITADSPTRNPLRLSLSNSSGNKNNGTIQAISNGVLILDQGFLDQSAGGLIVVDFQSPVILGANGQMPVIVGGFFKPVTGVIQANRVALNGCTIMGPGSANSTVGFQIPGGGLTAIQELGLTNNGHILINTNATNVPALLRFDASCAINGAGNIELNGPNPGQAVISANGVVVTLGAGQTITGRGDINMTANSAVLINNGTIGAGNKSSDTIRIALSDSAANKNNGVIKTLSDFSVGLFKIVLQQGRIDQSGGGSCFVSGTNRLPGTLEIGGPQSFTITGGSLSTEQADSPTALSVIKGIAAILDGDITLSAKFVIPANNFTLVPATRLTNNNTITLQANTSLLRFDNSTTIAGSGAIILTNNATLEINNNKFANNVTNGSGQTIKGSGTIHIDTGATLTNNGTIAPGTPAGTLNFDGNLQLTFASNLSFEIGGTVQGSDYGLLRKTDNSPLTLNGKLSVKLLNGFVPVATDTFSVVTTAATLQGAFINAPSGTRLNTSDGSGSFVVTYSGTNVVLSSFGSPIPAGQLLNIATRMQVLTGDNILIGGFIVTGSDPKKVVVRGLGPSLASSGVSGPLLDPTIELRDGSGALILANDNWKDSQATEIQNSGLAPKENSEAAIVTTLPANNSVYTVVLRGKSDSTGVGLVEVYDVNPSANSKLGNLSSRGFVGSGDNVMIGGVIIGANTANAATVLIRGLGPQLSGFGIPNALSDPILELHDPDGNLLALNDNWKDTQQATIQGGIPPADDREAAILVTLAPGNYTAILRGANGGIGNGLVEVYHLAQ
jgi:hypothetical protein